MALAAHSAPPRHLHGSRFCSKHAAPVRRRPANARRVDRRPAPAAVAAVSLDAVGALADASLVDAGGLNLAALVLPTIAAIGGVAALRFYAYSRLELITAAMLTNHVPRAGGAAGSGARVIQVGGGARELYYYPRDVVQVTAVGERVNRGLMEQAGVTAAVPCVARATPPTDLRFAPSGSVDAVVCVRALGALDAGARVAAVSEALRVLKPGCPLVFVERLADAGGALRVLPGGGGGVGVTLAELQALKAGGGSDGRVAGAQWDIALDGLDAHVAGVVVKAADGGGGARARKSDAGGGGGGAKKGFT